MQEFDLNIEKMLDNWSIYHAVREIIANALDEQTLTGTDEIKIFKDKNGDWHIRDYGRGLKHVHFTQNENEEKMKAPNLIGKFGVGLKDALATFYRHGVEVVIDSKHGHYTIGQTMKHGFSDIKTLHAYIEEPKNADFVGTDFVLKNCPDDEMKKAKSLFLKFSNFKKLDDTEYGEVYERGASGAACIWINGVKVAEESNFLFSYNITSLNAGLKKALNRERTNVGRSAYTDRVKSILLKSDADEVIERFVENLQQMNNGLQCEEIRWSDVQVHFIKILNKSKNVVFATPDQVKDLSGYGDEILEDSGKKIVFVPENILEKAEANSSDSEDGALTTISEVIMEYKKSFVYEFVDEKELSPSEKKVFSYKNSVLEIIHPDFDVGQIYISEILRPDEMHGATRGVHENGKVIIKRDVLKSREEFLGVLAHELIHHKSGEADCSREFENALTDCIGELLGKVFG